MKRPKKPIPEKYKNEAKAAEKIAVAAGKMVREGFSSGYTISRKGRIDLLTEVDLASEKLIKESIQKEFSKDGFFGEEGGGADFEKGRVWVVDPLDGTTNFTHGLKIFAVSIAFFENGIVRAGAVYQPMTDELFSAWENGGAYLNGKVIAVSRRKTVSTAMGVTGFPYNIEPVFTRILKQLGSILPVAEGVRRLGSASMDLCYVANGIFDFFWEFNLKPWDVAAGGLIVREAGGKVTDFLGRPDFVSSGRLLATNGLIHEEVIGLLR